MNHLPLLRTLRARLLCGIPALLVANGLLPATAAAQVREIRSDGQIVVTTTQRSKDAPVSASASAPGATILADRIEVSDIGIAGNRILTAAVANAATAELDETTATAPLWPTRAAVQADAVDALGAVFIASRQAIVRSPVWAEAANAGFRAIAGAIDNSQVTVSDNASRADARGNDHLAEMTRSGDGGIVVLQSATSSSQTQALQEGPASLIAGAVSGSTLALRANRQEANATTNIADAGLTAGGASGGYANLGRTTDIDDVGDVAVQAVNLVAQVQEAEAPTLAAVGGTAASGTRLDVGRAETSTLVSADNAASSASTANRASGALMVERPVISGEGGQAAVLTVQRLDSLVLANSGGSSAISVAGIVTGTSISADRNQVSAAAAGNVADADLQVRSGMVATVGGLPSNGALGALVTGEGASSLSAPLAVHSDQHVGRTSISAIVTQPGVVIGLGDQMSESSVVASGNSQSAQATANDAVSSLGIAAPVFVGSAGLLSLQASHADVSATLGDLDSPAGVTIAPSVGIEASWVAIRGNATRSSAAGNRSHNTIRLESADAGDGGFHTGARTGAVGDGYGASATAALSSVQEAGLPSEPSLVSSVAAGRYSVTGNIGLTSTAVTIEGNSQQSDAIANSSDNRLSVSAAALGDASTALSSSQTGAATVQAISTVKVVAPSSAEQSRIAITGNTNRAVAGTNEASNRLDVSGAGAGAPVPTHVDANALGGGNAAGGNVLLNTQFASGNVGANASLLAGGSGSLDGASDLSESSLVLSGNSSVADASGNRATNSAELGGSGGIASSQMNVGSVSALSQLRLVPHSGQVSGSTVAIEDNRAVALARGNFAENALWDNAASSSAAVSAEAGRQPTYATGPIALASAQTNHGAISASASDASIVPPLNAVGTLVAASRISASGNSASAVAYGNGAVNSLTLPMVGPASAALSTSQYNYGPVEARVIGGVATMGLADIRQSNRSITDNNVAANATGNVVNTVVTAIR